MAHSASLLNPKSEFDSFLFAAVGEDKKGTIVSVLTAFARLDFEPWQKAADFARLPKEAARTQLAGLIAALPGMSLTSSELGTVAARLIALLPASARASGLVQPSVASHNGSLGNIQAADARSSRSTLMSALLMAAWLVFQVAMGSQQPSQPAASDPAKTSDTTVPKAQPSLTGPAVQPPTGVAPPRKPLFGQ